MKRSRILLVVAALAVAAALVLVVGVRWFVHPGSQVPVERVVGPEAQLVVRIGDLAEDPGAVAAFERFLELVERFDASAGPGALWAPLELLARLERRYRHLPFGERREWLPREAAVAIEQDPATGLVAAVAAVNFRRYTRPLEGLIAREATGGGPGGRVEGPRGTRIYALEPRGYLAFHGGTIVASDDRSLLERTLRRLDDRGPPQEPRPAFAAPVGASVTGRIDLGARLPDAWVPVLREILPEASRLEPRLEQAAEEGLLPDAAMEASFALHVLSLDRFRLSWEIRAAVEDPAQVELEVDELLAELAIPIREGGLELTWSLVARPGSVSGEIEVRGVEGVVERSFAVGAPSSLPRPASPPWQGDV